MAITTCICIYMKKKHLVCSPTGDHNEVPVSIKRSNTITYAMHYDLHLESSLVVYCIA